MKRRDVAFWHFSTKIDVRFHVRYWGLSGHQDL